DARAEGSCLNLSSRAGQVILLHSYFRFERVGTRYLLGGVTPPSNPPRQAHLPRCTHPHLLSLISHRSSPASSFPPFLLSPITSAEGLSLFYKSLLPTHSAQSTSTHFCSTQLQHPCR